MTVSTRQNKSGTKQRGYVLQQPYTIVGRNGDPDRVVGPVVTDADFDKGDIVPWLLTAEEDEKRLHGLRRSTGQASWWEYPIFRGLIMLIGYVLVKRVFVDQHKIPGGLGFYPKFYRRGRLSSKAGRSDFTIIAAPTHADERDILITGSLARPLVWTCKPWFCSGPMWLAVLNHYNGALPIFRPQIDGVYHPKKNTLAMIHHHQMRSHRGSEALDIVTARLLEGDSAEFFIEGTRLAASEVSSGFFGAIRVSRRSRVLILPIAIVGVSEGDPVVRPGLLPWRRIILAVVCDPIKPDDFEGSDEECEQAMMAAWADSVNEGRARGRELILQHGRRVGVVPPKRTKPAESAEG